MLGSPMPSQPVASSSSVPQVFSFKNSTLDEVLEDLSRYAYQLVSKQPLAAHSGISRFILNLPEEELVSVERICFQVEQAYVDSQPKREGYPKQSCPVVTGTMRTSSARRSLHFLAWRSRHSLATSFAPAHYFNTGIKTMTRRSKIS